MPPWLCQPYVRVPPETHKQIIAEKVRRAEDPNRMKRQYFDNDGKEISRKKMKKLRRRMRRPNKPEGDHDRNLESCDQCLNPLVRFIFFDNFFLLENNILHIFVGLQMQISFVSYLLS